MTYSSMKCLDAAIKSRSLPPLRGKFLVLPNRRKWRHTVCTDQSRTKMASSWEHVFLLLSGWGIWCKLFLKQDSDENPLGLKVCWALQTKQKSESWWVSKANRRVKISAFSGLKLCSCCSEQELWLHLLLIVPVAHFGMREPGNKSTYTSVRCESHVLGGKWRNNFFWSFCHCRLDHSQFFYFHFGFEKCESNVRP